MDPTSHVPPSAQDSFDSARETPDTSISAYRVGHRNYRLSKSMSEILNANPTIRNASDLPSRRRLGDSQPSSKTPKGLFSSTIPAAAYLPDPFSPLTSSDSELSDEEEDGVEPIDEQEVYGKTISSRILKSPALHLPDDMCCVSKSTLSSRCEPASSADRPRPHLTDLRS